MNTKKIIRNILFSFLWLVISGGVLILLIAANGNKKKNICAGHRITIKSLHDQLFIDELEVLRLLGSSTGGQIKNEPLSSFNLRKLEELLEGNVWIRDAELWFDNKDLLHVSVTERSPIARIFTTAGNSFYIDQTIRRMPLSERISVSIPVFTGFPEKKLWSAKDSLLLHATREIAEFISSDRFWSSQVAQIDISNTKEFDIVPLIGNHTIKFGNAENVAQKFNKLFVFYEKVLSKTGFEKYSTIDIQYSGQVIGTRKGTGKTAIDSLQLKLNVEKLLNQIKKVRNESEAQTVMTIEKPPIQVDSLAAPLPNSEMSTDPNAMKTIPVPKKVPKALMKKVSGE